MDHTTHDFIRTTAELGVDGFIFFFFLIYILYYYTRLPADTDRQRRTCSAWSTAVAAAAEAATAVAAVAPEAAVTWTSKWCTPTPTGRCPYCPTRRPAYPRGVRRPCHWPRPT